MPIDVTNEHGRNRRLRHRVVRPPTHALRHFYASVLIDAGESVKAVAEYLGHADPGFTLRVYAHLFPASEDRARKAVEAAFNGQDYPSRAARGG